MQNPCK